MQRFPKQKPFDSVIFRSNHAEIRRLDELRHQCIRDLFCHDADSLPKALAAVFGAEQQNPEPVCIAGNAPFGGILTGIVHRTGIVAVASADLRQIRLCPDFQRKVRSFAVKE